MRMKAPEQGAQMAAQSRTLPGGWGPVSCPRQLGCLQGTPGDMLCLECARAVREGLHPLLSSGKGPGSQSRPGLQGLTGWGQGRDPRLLKCLTWASHPRAQLMASLAPSVAKAEEVDANTGLGHGPPSHTYRHAARKCLPSQHSQTLPVSKHLHCHQFQIST